jgi:hypothetical protein
MSFLRRALACCVLPLAFAAAVGCGDDAASKANKDLKPVDPNAPKPVGAGAGAGGGGAGAGAAGAGVVK